MKHSHYLRGWLVGVALLALLPAGPGYAQNLEQTPAPVGDGRVDEATDAEPDTEPDRFRFIDVFDADPGTAYIDIAVISGINRPADIGISGGEYRIDGGNWTDQDGTVLDGQLVDVRLVSAAEPAVTVEARLTVGGVSDSFSVTTLPASGGSLLYDEAKQADLNGDQERPTAIGSLAPGVNLVRGRHAWLDPVTETGSGQGDAFSVAVPPGMKITSVRVTVSNFRDYRGGTLAGPRVFTTPTFRVPNGGDIYWSTTAGFPSPRTLSWDGLLPPLPAGKNYGFGLQFFSVEPGAAPSYDWEWRIDVSP